MELINHHLKSAKPVKTPYLYVSKTSQTKRRHTTYCVATRHYDHAILTAFMWITEAWMLFNERHVRLLITGSRGKPARSFSITCNVDLSE